MRTHPVRDEIFVARTYNYNLHPVGMRYHSSFILSHPYGMVICFFVCATNILSLTGQLIPTVTEIASLNSVTIRKNEPRRKEGHEGRL